MQLLDLTITLCFTFFSQIQNRAAIESNLLSENISIFGEQSKLEILPMKVVKGLLLVSGEVEGKKGYFIIDSGAPDLVINTPVSDQCISKTVKASSFAKEVMLCTTKFNDIQWGTYKYKKRTALTLNLNHLEEYTQLPILGLLGYEVLKNKLIGFHPAQSSLFLSDNLQKFELKRKPKIQIPFTMEGHLPIVSIELQEQNYRFVFDTGSAKNLICKKIHSGLSSNILTHNKIELQGLDQSTQIISTFSVDQILLEDYTLYNQTFLPINLNHLQQEKQLNIDGILGYPSFRELFFILDYKSKTLYILN